MTSTRVTHSRHLEFKSSRWPVTPFLIARTWKLFGQDKETVAQLALDWQKPKSSVKEYFAELGLCLAIAEEADHAKEHGHGSPWMLKRYGLPTSDQHAKRRTSRAKHFATDALSDYAGWELRDKDGRHIATPGSRDHKRRPIFSLRVEDGSDAPGDADDYVEDIADGAPRARVPVLRSRDAEDEKRHREIISSYGRDGLENHEALFGLADEPMAHGFTVEMLYDIASPKERELLEMLDERTFAEIDHIKGWTHGYARTLAKRLERKAKRQRDG